MVDIAVIGGGPAGLSAAMNARVRGKGVLVVSGPIEENPLYQAPVVENYPGLPGVSGARLLQLMEEHARDSGARLRTGRVLRAAPVGGRFFLSIGSEVEEAQALVLATGAQRGAKLTGEEALLGKGVSWCATCDGMMFRNQPVVVVGLAHDAPAEANFLQEIGCQVTYVSRQTPAGLRPDIPVVLGRRLAVEGERTVTAVRVDEASIPCRGAFILRDAVAPGDLMPGLALEDGCISVSRAMEASIPGVFACGDGTGRPFQIAKAVGEGLVAGQSAADYVERLGMEKL